MDFTPTPKTKDYLKRVKAFIATNIDPAVVEIRKKNRELNRGGDWKRWQTIPLVEELKKKARAEGLWNLFLPDEKLGAGLTVVEYAYLAELMGQFEFAPEIFNCNAPDTGNMEVLYHYGSEWQKQTWLRPLLEGSIRSVFCMTEPEVASSDATNMAATIVEHGDELVINGRKWWSTAIGHPRAKVSIFMGLSNPQAPIHQRHSMVVVPLDLPGVRIERMLTVHGEYDAPYGHGEVVFENVRVPKTHLILGHGKGFEIAQGRLGPGRIHHCMRCIGAAELALKLMIERGLSRVAFGKNLLELGGNMERVAEARMAIDQARLLTLYAAWKIQAEGVRASMNEISAIKVVAPNMLQKVVDMAIQIHGGAGVCEDTPLAALYASARSLRLADGPDEVHRALVARTELRKYKRRDTV